MFVELESGNPSLNTLQIQELHERDHAEVAHFEQQESNDLSNILEEIHSKSLQGAPIIDLIPALSIVLTNPTDDEMSEAFKRCVVDIMNESGDSDDFRQVLISTIVDYPELDKHKVPLTQIVTKISNDLGEDDQLLNQILLNLFRFVIINKGNLILTV
jgi:hypothetical protein